jgi:hypothetical protein
LLSTRENTLVIGRSRILVLLWIIGEIDRVCVCV